MSDSHQAGNRPNVLAKASAILCLVALVLASPPSLSAAEESWATWYGQPFHGRTMANGQVYDMNDPTTTASNLFPFGTWLKVTNPTNGKSVVVQVRDRGAFKHAVDLSYAAFALIDNPAKMMIRVQYEVVPGPGAPPAVAAPAPKPAAEAPKPAAQAPKPAPEPQKPSPLPAEYVVVRGDSLFGIARRFALDVTDLAKWNDLADANRLAAGQRLLLRAPAAAHSQPPSARGEVARESAVPSGFHVVVEGDTMWDLATKHGTSPDRLAELNDLSDSGIIVVGQRLRVPGAAAKVAAGAASAGPRQHVAQPGDTIFDIAMRYGTTETILAQLNGIADVDLIQIGQELALP